MDNKTHIVEMDSKGRLSLAALIPPNERSGVFLVECTASGGFILERAVVIPQTEYDELKRRAGRN